MPTQHSRATVKKMSFGEAKKAAVRALNKHFDSILAVAQSKGPNEAVSKCIKCGRWTTTLMLSNGIVSCPFCSGDNWADIFSALSHMPGGKKMIGALSNKYKDENKENITTIKSPRFKWWSIILNFITRGKVDRRIARYGRIINQVHPMALKSKKDFDKNWVSVLLFAPKWFIEKHYGELQFIVKQKVKAPLKVPIPKEENKQEPSE